MDMGIHCLDLISFITGMRVTEVAAMNENVLFRDPGYEVEDSSAVLLRMENGAQFFVQSSFNIPMQKPSGISICSAARGA